MKQSKKIALSAMAVSLGTLFMIIGAVFEVMDLSSSALASLAVVFVYVEVGSPYTWLTWLCTALLSFVFFPGSMLWLMYFVLFGIYPILKGYIERAPKVLWWPLKIALGNLSLLLLVLGTEFILGVSFFGDTSVIPWLSPIVVYIILWLIMNIAIILYDIFIGVMLRFYYDRIRPKITRLLK